MKTIKLVKLEEREDATHPHNIEVGTEVVVDVYDHYFFTPQVRISACTMRCATQQDD